MKKLLIFGTSRGLGQSLAQWAPNHFTSLETMDLVSRKPPSPPSSPHRLWTCDLSSPLERETLFSQVDLGSFDHVIFNAGGGPHGEYSQKQWKDHHWALQVGLLAPMQCVYLWLNKRPREDSGKFITVGSRIAGMGPAPLAASYSAAKHGLVGFVGSLQDELKGDCRKVWLFSPGYMNTGMLPPTASVRQDGTRIMETDAAAQALLRWIKKDGPWHRILN